MCGMTSQLHTTALYSFLAIAYYIEVVLYGTLNYELLVTNEYVKTPLTFTFIMLHLQYYNVMTFAFFPSWMSSFHYLMMTDVSLPTGVQVTPMHIVPTVVYLCFTVTTVTTVYVRIHTHLFN